MATLDPGQMPQYQVDPGGQCSTKHHHGSHHTLAAPHPNPQVESQLCAEVFSLPYIHAGRLVSGSNHSKALRAKSCCGQREVLLLTGELSSVIIASGVRLYVLISQMDLNDATCQSPSRDGPRSY